MPSDSPYPSPFADRPRVIENELAFAIEDGFPVSPGHTLVIPKRMFADYFDATAEEVAALWNLVNLVHRQLVATLQPDGFNIGINVGSHGGQSVMHMHIHVIPRYAGDVEEPFGGVRGVIPGKAKYPQKNQAGDRP